MKIYAPEGTVGLPVHGLAPFVRPISDSGLIGLDNGKPGAALLLEATGKRFCQRTGARWLGIRAKGSAATPVERALLRELVGEGNLALTGTAD